MDEYAFLRRYNDVFLVKRQSARSKLWKIISAHITNSKAEQVLTDLKKKDRLKHKDPNFYDYKIDILKRTG